MKQTARDVMQSQVVSLSTEDPLHVAQRLFYEEGIHGAPVVDDRGVVVGMLTISDILRALTEEKEAAPAEPGPFRSDLDDVFGSWQIAPEDFKARVQDVLVSDYMTEDYVAVRPDTPVRDVARSMRENQIHRVLVLDDGSLCGIVSTFDLVGLIEQEG